MVYAPVNIYIPDGEQYNVYATTDKRWPFGATGYTQDGRKYRFASNGVAGVTVVGTVYQGAIGISGDVGRTAIAAVLGARSPTVTLNVGAAANFYAEGYFCVDVTPGEGLYTIDNHAVCTTAANAYNLAQGQAIRQAALTTSSRVSLIQNPYKNIIVVPAPQTAGLAGVCVSVMVASGGMGWVQTGGLAVVLASGTLVVGNAAVTSIGAGAAGPAGAASTLIAQQTIGQSVRIGGTWAEIRLAGID